MSSSQQQQRSSFSATGSFSTFTTSSSSFSSSIRSSVSGDGNQSHRKIFTERASFNSRDGGRIERTTEETGKPTLHETTDLDPHGRSLGGTSSGGARRIEDVSEDDRRQHQQEHQEK